MRILQIRATLKRGLQCVALGVLILAAPPCVLTPATSAAGDPITVFVDVNVIPMNAERVLSHQTVVVQGDRIAAIGSAEDLAVPDGAHVINAQGAYLLPGLADMHEHIGDNVDSLKLFLANGVTTVRNFNSQRAILQLRDLIESGELLGPHIWAGRQLAGIPPQIKTIFSRVSNAMGPVLELNPVALADYLVEDPDHAREQVLRAKQEGFDFIKTQWYLTREMFDAMMETATSLGMKLVGHIEADIGPEYYIKAGANPEHNYQLLALVAKDYVRKPGANPLDYFDLSEADERIPGLVAMMAESGVAYTPTLVTNDIMFQIFDYIEDISGSPLFQRPEYRYVPPEYLHAWADATEGEFRVVMEARGVTDIRDLLPGPAYKQEVMEVSKRIVKALHDGGVPILAGTDSIDPGIVWGFSIHQEFELLFSAGLTPFEVLETATRVPAEFLGNPQEWGTVEVGKRADLLLLNANPLDDIANTRQIAGVMVSGRWLPQAELQGILYALAAKYEAQKADQ